VHGFLTTAIGAADGDAGDLGVEAQGFEDFLGEWSDTA